MKIAVFDIGTNSIHLLVAETYPNDSFKVLLHLRDATRLGDGSFLSKKLSIKKIKKAIKVINRFNSLAKKIQVDYTIAVATSAVRDSQNRHQFIAHVFKKTGLKIKVISGLEEARLIYLGVQSDRRLKQQKALVIDIGGGSVELILGCDGKILYSNSFHLGVARLTQKFMRHDPPLEKELQACAAFVEKKISEALKKIRKKGFSNVIGSSGTLFNLANMIRLREGLEFSRGEFEKLYKRLVIMNLKERRKIAGLSSKRADTIVAGCVVVRTLFQLLDIGKIQLSRFAIREGVVIDFMVKSRHGSI